MLDSLNISNGHLEISRTFNSMDLDTLLCGAHYNPLLAAVIHAPNPVKVFDPMELSPKEIPEKKMKKRCQAHECPKPKEQVQKELFQEEDDTQEIGKKYTVLEIVQKRRRKVKQNSSFPIIVLIFFFMIKFYKGFDEYLVTTKEEPTKPHWMRRENLKGEFDTLLSSFEVLPEHNRIFEGLSCHQCKVRKNIIVLCKNFPQERDLSGKVLF